MQNKINQDDSAVSFDSLLKLLDRNSPSSGAEKRKYAARKIHFAGELKKYLQFLSRFEQRIKQRHADKKVLQREINARSGRIILSGNLLEKEINSPSARKKVKELFRGCVKKWIFQSRILKRGLTKPRGYAGDYKIIEMFYDHEPISGGMGYYLDGFGLGNTLATADIYRKDKMRELLRDFIEKSHAQETGIVNFGCGGCKDIRDLFNSYSPGRKVSFLAVDQDPEALRFSKSAVKLPQRVRIKFLRENIIDLIFRYRHKEPQAPFVNKQLAYSIGLVDYFADNTLQLFVRFGLKTLVPGGRLIFAHKNKEKWESFLTPDWFCDWRFYQRTLDEVLRIIKSEIKGCDLKISWEKTRHMFFLSITKNAH